MIFSYLILRHARPARWIFYNLCNDDWVFELLDLSSPPRAQETCKKPDLNSFYQAHSSPPNFRLLVPELHKAGCLSQPKWGTQVGGPTRFGAQQGFSQNGPTWVWCGGFGWHIISVLMGTMGSIKPLPLLGFLSPSLGSAINTQIMAPGPTQFSAGNTQIWA